MTTAIKLVQGDTKPSLNVTLLNEDTNTPINLTGATIVMYFRESETVTLLDTLVATIVNAAAGTIIIPWNSDTLLVPEGTYEGEIEVTFSDGSVQSVFTPIYFALRAQFDDPV